MFISNMLSGKIEIEFSVTSNTIEAVFRGKEQKMLGEYRLTLWENYGEDNQSVVDYCDAFQLVSSTCEENDGRRCLHMNYYNAKYTDMMLYKHNSGYDTAPY